MKRSGQKSDTRTLQRETGALKVGGVSPLSESLRGKYTRERRQQPPAIDQSGHAVCIFYRSLPRKPVVPDTGDYRGEGSLDLKRKANPAPDVTIDVHHRANTNFHVVSIDMVAPSFPSPTRTLISPAGPAGPRFDRTSLLVKGQKSPALTMWGR